MYSDYVKAVFNYSTVYIIINNNIKLNYYKSCF